MLVTIQQVMPIVARTYPNKLTGREDTFYSKGYVLSDGLNTMYAEAIGNLAQRLEREPINTEGFVNVELSYMVHSYDTKDGVKKYTTDITIQRMSNF